MGRAAKYISPSTIKRNNRRLVAFLHRRLIHLIMSQSEATKPVVAAVSEVHVSDAPEDLSPDVSEVLAFDATEDLALDALEELDLDDYEDLKVNDHP